MLRAALFAWATLKQVLRQNFIFVSFNECKKIPKNERYVGELHTHKCRVICNNRFGNVNIKNIFTRKYF